MGLHGKMLNGVPVNGSSCITYLTVDSRQPKFTKIEAFTPSITVTFFWYVSEPDRAVFLLNTVNCQ